MPDAREETKMNIDRMDTAKDALDLTPQESRDFNNYFIGAVSGSVEPSEWIAALDVAKHCIESSRPKNTSQNLLPIATA
jgi:hypothetical protein